jgi:antagonist of KipI
MIEVIKPGLLTTIQDQGRWGYQCYGVGISGALDSFALAAANRLVGNAEGAAGLEITLQGPTLKFHRETILALAGADLGPKLNGNPISHWTCHWAPEGSILSFSGRKSGVRAYLAVSGGIDVPLVMGSRSTYLMGRFGGMEGRPLRTADRLPIPKPKANHRESIGRELPAEYRPPYGRNPEIRVIRGPFEEFFSDRGITAFYSTEYSITPQSDRMGYRLEGEPVSRKKSEELITCGLAQGTIQVPPNGQPIVLLADRQTIGGYPIIATAAHVDLPLIAQCAPGEKLRFRPVLPEEAQDAYRSLWSGLRSFLKD